MALRFSCENRFKECCPALDLPRDSALPVCVSSVFHLWPGFFGCGRPAAMRRGFPALEFSMMKKLFSQAKLGIDNLTFT